MAISNIAVLAGLLAKLPSFCSVLSLPSHSAAVSLRIFVYSDIIDSFFSANISSWWPNDSSQKAAGIFISTVGARLWNQAQRGKGAGLESVMLLACTHMHAYIDQKLTDWCLVKEMRGWGQQAERWSCWLFLSCSKCCQLPHTCSNTRNPMRRVTAEDIFKEQGPGQRKNNNLLICWTENCINLSNFSNFLCQKVETSYMTPN